MLIHFPIESVTYTDLLKPLEWWCQRPITAENNALLSSRDFPFLGRSVSFEYAGPGMIRYTIQARACAMWFRVKQRQIQVERESLDLVFFPTMSGSLFIPDIDLPLSLSKDHTVSELLEFGLILGVDFDGVL